MPDQTLLDNQLAAGETIGKVWKNTLKLGADNQTIEVLQSRLALLENYWKEYVARNNNLFTNRDDFKGHAYYTNDVYSEVEATYINTKIKLKSKLAEKMGVVQELLSADTAPITDVASASSSSLLQPKVPKFSGKYEDWDTFKELFCSLVKNDARLSSVRKLQLLLTAVEGDAARRLSNFQVTGDNFDVAWQTLERRYDNKRLRLAVQLNRLIGMTPATSKSVREINRLLDTTNECKRALQSLGRPVEHWDDWFVQLVVCNLDSSTREDWEKSLEGVQTFPTYTTLVNFIENRTHSLDTARCSDSHFQRGFTKSKQPLPERLSLLHRALS